MKELSLETAVLQSSYGHPRRYTIQHKSQDYATDMETYGLPHYKTRQQHSTHQHATTICRKPMQSHHKNGTTTYPIQRGAYGAPCIDYVVLVFDYGNNTFAEDYNNKDYNKPCKSDRCLFATSQLCTLVYVDDLLLVGCLATINKLYIYIHMYTYAQLKQMFTLKQLQHCLQPRIFVVGKRPQWQQDGLISIALGQGYHNSSQLQPCGVNQVLRKTELACCVGPKKPPELMATSL